MKRVYSAPHNSYVLCCKYPDRDPRDQWQVGFLDYTVNYHDTGKKRDNVFVMQDKHRSYFKCCYLITFEEGFDILASMDPSSIKCNGTPGKPALRGNES